MYDPVMVQPMREELKGIGFTELTSREEVDEAFNGTSGTALLVVNSVCGCAAGQARPGVALSLTNSRIPDRLYTVFAGQDPEATARARSYLKGYPPSSPSVALFKDGEVVAMLERHQIENRSADQVAASLIQEFERFC
jgi:putative YphP/YqiW family bacilliredoxin